MAVRKLVLAAALSLALAGTAVANDGIVAKIDYQKAKDALNAAEIRSKHASQAAGLESEDVTLALKTKADELERQRPDLV